MATKVPEQGVLAARGVAGFVGSDIVQGDWTTQNAGVVSTQKVELHGSGAPTAGTSEVQTITRDADGGTFAVSFDGASTAQLAWNVSAANMQTALRALATINGAHVGVGLVGAVYTLTFTGNLGKLDLPSVVTDVHALTKGAGAGTAVVAVGTPGVTATGRNYAKGSTYQDDDTGNQYVNTGTGLAPVWTGVGTAIDAEIATLAGKIPEAAEADLGALTAAAPAAVTAAAPAAITATTPGTGADATTPTGAQYAAAVADITAVRAEVVKLVTDLTATRAEVAKLVTDLGNSRTKVNGLLAKLRDAGIVTP